MNAKSGLFTRRVARSAATALSAVLALCLVPAATATAAPEGTNYACAGTTAASSTFSGYSTARVNDCDTSTALGGAHSWANANGAAYYPPNYAQWVFVALPTAQTISRVVVHTTAGYPLRDFDVQVQNEHVFDTLATINYNTDTVVTVTFPPRSARVIRILGKTGPIHQPGFVRINELQVFDF
ncbi:galactose-binding domain-containing protein [Saccharothrix sp. Mg75]|uniref:galactose-binding domain-containing protein n=1 Tax=Saccharothrix sp. Mg75 TaxID=3445357 RepID=UPI003EEC0250